jgi:DNA repair protein SbcD/Mre11
LRLVHLADLHLGYRQYQRLTPTGINQREADIGRTFQRAIDKVIEIAPDLVLIAGDVFHSPRPSNQSIVHAIRQFLRLRSALPEAVVVMIAGDHDTPRAVETGGILGLFGELGFEVAATAARRMQFPDRDLEILAVPSVPGDRPSLTPNPAVRHNVLVIHGETPDAIHRPNWHPEPASLEIPLSELRAESWSYVALGHFHVYRHVHGNAYYSGSLDYSSVNVWGELQEEQALPAKARGKGIIEHDLISGAHTFHRLDPARPVIDLPFIRARGMTAPEVDVAIREAVEACEGGIDARLVRLLVYDVPRHIARGLDQRALRDYRRRAFHFHLDLRRPDVVRVRSSGAPGRRASLSDLVRDNLRSRQLDRDIDREELVSLGLRYLRDAEAVESPVTVEQEAE